MSFLLFVEQAAPETPSANQVVVYPKADGRVYSKDDAGTERAISASAAATTDNAVARYDGTAGALQNSGVIISDTDALTGIASISGLTTDLAVAEGGTGVSTLADGGLVVGNAAAAVEVVAAGATTEILVGGGALTNPVWTAATGTGAPVRAGSPTITGTLTAATVNTSGDVTISKADPTLFLNDSGTSQAAVILQQSSTTRWRLRLRGAGSDVLVFSDEVQEQLAMTRTTGALTLAGALTLTAGQIAFPATQNASAGANTLDDYEEGTWTPSVGGTATYTTQAGTYTKIGHRVIVDCWLVINAIGTGSTTVVSGLPFTAPATRVVLATGVFDSSGTAIVSATAVTNSSAATLTVRSRTAASAGDAVNAIFSTSTDTRFAGSYAI